MAKTGNTAGSGTEHQVVGKVFILYGTVKAMSPDGVVRVLAPNSPIFANDQIITESDGSVSIMIDGLDGAPPTQLDLGRMSTVTIDADIYGGTTPEATSDSAAQAEQIQQALLSEDNPIELEATAAGGATGAGGGHPVFTLTSTGAEGEVTSGAGNTGEPGTTGPTFVGTFAGDGTPTAGEISAATLDDEGLSGGIHGGIGDVAGEPTTTTGTLPHDFGPDGAGSVSFASMDGTTGELGVEEVSYSWNADTNTLTASSEERGDIFTVVVDPATGAYTLQLLQNVLHEPGGDENNALADLTYTVTDADGDTAPGTLTININDDTPVAQAATAVVNEPTVGESTEISGSYNITIVLDHSGSMGDDPDGPGGFATRLALAKDAINNLLTEYGDNATNVNVLIVGFAADAAASGWMSLADAQNYVNGLTTASWTDYEAALETTMTAFDANTPDADTNVLYFLSDGVPTDGGVGYDHHLSDGDITAWETWLAGHDMDAYAVGIGNGVSATDPDLLAVAYSEDPDGAANDVIIVHDGEDLSATLLSIVVPGPEILDTVTGDVFTPASDAGADGATVTAISYTDAEGNPASADVPEIGSVIVHTALGDLTISADGSYSYTATHGVDVDTNDVFTYTLTDGDGDTSTAPLTITVDSVPEAYDISESVQSSQITINLGNTDLTSGIGGTGDMVHVTVTAPGDAIPHLINNGGAFGIDSSVDGNESYSHEINHLDGTNSEVMSFMLQDGKTATDASVDITAFYKGEDMNWPAPGTANEIGSYELYNNNVLVGGDTFTADSYGGTYHLNIHGPAGGFDEIRFSALQGSPADYDPAGGDSSDYNVKSITFDLAPQAEGNLLADSTPEGTFGGDLSGAHVQSIAGVGGGSADSAISSTDDLTVTGQYDGTLTVQSNGHYIYTASSAAPAGATESFSFTLIDGDGDTASAQLNMLIDDPNNN